MSDVIDIRWVRLAQRAQAVLAETQAQFATADFIARHDLPIVAQRLRVAALLRLGAVKLEVEAFAA